MSKADYVRAEIGSGKTQGHHCHWPNCNKQCAPAAWGCRKHWFMLPAPIRNRIWQTFRPGQERDKNPSRDYVEAAKEAQAWIAEHHPPEMRLNL